MILKSGNRPLWPKSLSTGVIQPGLIFTTHSMLFMSRETYLTNIFELDKNFYHFQITQCNSYLILNIIMKDTVYVSDNK